jgi:ribosomal protein L7/L12
MNPSPPSNTSPAQVRVTGWRVGAQTVAAIQAVREATQVGLADAKRLVEDVLSGAPIILDVGDEKSAQELVSTLDRLKFTAQLFRL